MFEKVVCGYKNSPLSSNADEKKKLQQNKLNLQNTIQSSLAKAYRKSNPTISHFYNNAGYSDVPVWALFEILMLGDFGSLLQCLTFDVRDDISKRLGLNLSCDTNRELLYKYIYVFKDLRNAIAHNAVVFDTRFRKIEPSKAMKQTLINEIKLPYINFKTIGDYVILVCYYLKMLRVPKQEIKTFIREFERITFIYSNSVDPKIASIVVHPDTSARMNLLKKYLA